MNFSSQVERMVWMYGRGYSLGTIAEQLGVHRETVRRCMLSLGIDTNLHNRKVAEAKKYSTMIHSLRADGIPWRSISDKIGFSERTLRRYSML